MAVTLDELNRLPVAEFTAKLGAIFEHSPWVAEQAAAGRPFADVDSLHFIPGTNTFENVEAN